MLGFNKEDRRLYGQLLTPSWLSGMLAIVIGLTISIGVIVAFSAHNSAVQQQLIAWQSHKPQRALTTPDQTLEEIDHPTVAGSWPLVVVWGAVGIAVYMITMGLVHVLSDAAALRESLDYVNAKPKALIETTVEHAVLRIVSGIIFISFIILFVKRVVPYSITAAHASASDVASLNGLLYAFLSFAIVAVSLHIAVIFGRLTIGRVRVFSN